MNWGKALAISLIAFAGMMTFFVVMAAWNPEPLVTERYYEQELKYQERIDDAARASGLSAAVAIEVIGDAVFLRFPEELKAGTLKGELTLLCTNDPAGDRVIHVNSDANGEFISFPLALRPGRYNAQLEWVADGRSYYTEQKLIVR